jgi:hypothetical protein
MAIEGKKEYMQNPHGRKSAKKISKGSVTQQKREGIMV